MTFSKFSAEVYQKLGEKIKKCFTLILYTIESLLSSVDQSFSLIREQTNWLLVWAASHSNLELDKRQMTHLFPNPLRANMDDHLLHSNHDSLLCFPHHFETTLCLCLCPSRRMMDSISPPKEEQMYNESVALKLWGGHLPNCVYIVIIVFKMNNEPFKAL